MIFFRSDGNELEASGAVAAQDGATNEQEFFPGGIIGFSLDFDQQISCWWRGIFECIIIHIDLLIETV